MMVARVLVESDEVVGITLPGGGEEAGMAAKPAKNPAT